MVTLNLFNFNNYYDRVSKYYATLQEYTENGLLLYSWQDRNFNPNDGVSTSCVFNYSGAQPDYCVVTDVYGKIDSRWFVIEARRTTGGQYLVTLLRDLVADYREVVLNSPCFIEKATLKIDDDLLFNKENMTFNQIRKEQTLIYDETGVPWIVGYLPKDTTIEGTTVEGTTIVNPPQIDITVEGIENWEYNSLLNESLLAYGSDQRLLIDLGYVTTWQKNWFGNLKGQYTPAELWVDPRNNSGYSKLGVRSEDFLNISELSELPIPIYGAVGTSYSFVHATAQTLTELLLATLKNIPSFTTKLTNSISSSLAALGPTAQPYRQLTQLNDKVLFD